MIYAETDPPHQELYDLQRNPNATRNLASEPVDVAVRDERPARWQSRQHDAR
jgi:hypothetical protein